VACNFGHRAILLDVKANFAKRGTPIQSQNSHDRSSLIVVLKKSSAGQQHADTAHPLAFAHAASGQAVAPPSSVMKSLRLTDRDHATARPLKLVLEHRE
jgi:hypothetical protein